MLASIYVDIHIYVSVCMAARLFLVLLTALLALFDQVLFLLFLVLSLLGWIDFAWESPRFGHLTTLYFFCRVGC